MSHYKPYPEYKDSGVEWLGQVPKHWVVSRLRHNIAGSLSYGANEAAESDDPRNPRFIRITDLNEDGTLRDDTFKSLPPDIARPYLLKDSDILLARSGATVGKSFIYRREMGEACYAGYLIRARLLESKFLPRLFWHCTQSSYYWDFIAGSNIQATIQNVSAEKYSNLWVAVPPITEQKGIVFGLDCETARIDALVEKKTRFIELLREKRQALITHAVTKGLDLNVKMKDSGVEWLGEVPEHWEVSPLKYIVAFRSGGTPSKDNLAFWDGDIPWASAKDLKVDQLHDTQDHLTELAIASNAASLISAGSVLVVVRGMILARIFPVVEAMVPMAINQDLKALQASKKLEGKFLAHLLRGLASESLRRLEEAGHGTKALRMEAWTSMQLTVPPVGEQRLILAYLDSETERLDNLLSKTERSIELLKERRSALITAAVTGQIDLREAV